jgi:hypothetical protein
MPKEPRNKIINGKKKCNICNLIKPTAEYYYYKNKPRSYCKNCGYVANKKARAKRDPSIEKGYTKKMWRNPLYRAKKYAYAQKRKTRIKKECVKYKGGCCTICGYNKCINALEFHHVDPKTKSNDLAKGRGIDTRMRLETLKPELDKCILLCANCHREVHYE